MFLNTSTSDDFSSYPWLCIYYCTGNFDLLPHVLYSLCWVLGRRRVLGRRTRIDLCEGCGAPRSAGRDISCLDFLQLCRSCTLVNIFVLFY